MENKELYINYLSKLEDALIENNFDNIDYILETIFTIWINEDDLDEMNDILHEATLYSEFKEQDYKDEALKLIWKFK